MELIALATARGVSISAHQLVRWHKAGLIPWLRRRPLGYGRGSESIYPAEAVETAIAISEKLVRRRDLDVAAWELWWEGRIRSPLPMRLLLQSHIAACRTMRAKALARRADDETMDEAMAGVEAWHREHRRWGALSPFRHRIGADGLSMLTLLLQELMLGIHDPVGDNERAATVLSFLGIPSHVLTADDVAQQFGWLSDLCEPDHLANTLEAIGNERLAALPTEFRKLDAIARAAAAWLCAPLGQSRAVDEITTLLSVPPAPHTVLFWLAFQERTGIDLDTVFATLPALLQALHSSTPDDK